MSKELKALEAWERANNNVYEHGYEISGDLCYIIETALKALEIIKSKKRDIGMNIGFALGLDKEKLYSITIYDLTKEEYNLLEEALCEE